MNVIGQYTNINLKSMCIVSAFNIAVFLLKPLFACIYYSIVINTCMRRRSIRNININRNIINNNNNNNKIDKTITRSIALYRKPYFKWDGIGRNDIEMQTV